jgi:hypothetical protein
MYICCCCYIFWPHMGHHQATPVMGSPLHCTLVLSTYRQLVIVVSFLHRMISSYLFGGCFSVLFGVLFTFVVY